MNSTYSDLKKFIHSPAYDFVEVAFIASGLTDRDTLVRSLRSGVVLVDLDEAKNGVDQIVEFLETHRGIGVVHLITHGKAGHIELGNVSLTNENIDSFKPHLTSIGKSLARNAELHIYGCEVASSEQGSKLIDTLAHLTEKSVAASTNLTGAANLGGDWNLEARIGVIQASSAFEAKAIVAYSSVLVVDDENFVGAVDVYTGSRVFDGWTFSTGGNPRWIVDTSSNYILNLNGPSDYSLYIYQAPLLTFKSTDGSEFKLNSFDWYSAQGIITIKGYRDGIEVASEGVYLWQSDSSGEITYVKNAAGNYGQLSFGSAFANIDEVRVDTTYNSAMEIDSIDVSAAVVVPTITSGTYDASTGILTVTGTNMAATGGGYNDIDVSKLTLKGQGGNTYTLTSANVEITSSTSFSVTLNSTDQLNVNGLLNKNGTSSVYGTTYNVAGAAGWNVAASSAADTTGNGVIVTNVTSPAITSATFDAMTGVLTVSGSNLVKQVGATNDITVSTLTIAGEGGSAYTLTSADVEIASGSTFSVTLNATDLAYINQILNKNGTSSSGGSTYNLAAVDDWNTVIGNTNISDSTNGITVSNVTVPSITSATYDGNTGVLVVTGTGFTQSSGATNDIVANKFTFTGNAGATRTLTDTANAEITSGTRFTLTLSATDKAAVNLLLNQNGTSSSGATTYNLAAAEDWAAGADAAVVVADLTGNGITVSNAVDSTPPSAPSTPDMSSGSDSGTSSTDNITNVTTPTFSGTTEANATVRLYDTDGTTQLGTTTADGAGNWSITSTTLSEGAHTVTTKATDASNNTSVASSGLSVTIDTTAPSAPSAPDMVAGSDSGVSSSDDITNDTTPTFTGTSEANASVTMYDTDGTTVLGTTTADGSGNWSLTSSTLSTGNHTLTTKASDVAGNVSSASSGLSVSIETTAPTVSTINRVTSSLTNATSVDYTVSFAENVYGVDTSDFSLTATGSASGTIDSVAQLSASTYTVTVNTLSGDGSLRLDLNNSGTGISDTAGNAIATGYTSGQIYTLDHTSPAVTSVAVPANSTYTAGQTLDFTVNFNETVTVNTGGVPPFITLMLDTGGPVQATYVSGSGTSALVFRYTVQSGNADSDGVSISSVISANGSTLRDAAGNDANLALNSVGSTTSVLVDALPPTTTIATAVFSADTGASTTDFITSTAAQNISGTLSTNLAAGEAVKVSLDNGATWTTATTNVGQSTWSLASQTLLVSDTLKVKVTDVNGSGSVMSQAYVLDTTGPTLQSTTPADNATSVAVAANVLMSFAEDVIAVAGKSVNLYKTADNSLVESIAVNDVTKVTVAGGVVTVDPTATLTETTGYYVLVDNGAFTDSAGSVYGGITSTTDFNFTTLTTPPPAPVEPTVTEVISAAFRGTNSVTLHPDAPVMYITLVADSMAGKIDTLDNNTATMRDIHQLDQPNSTPSGMQMPLGLISFESGVSSNGQNETFSLYVDSSLQVNGYWVQSKAGFWVNLASEAYGGHMATEGNKLRLDFQLKDGGEFDFDGIADGVITNSGAAAAMPLSLIGYRPDLPSTDFWF